MCLSFIDGVPSELIRMRCSVKNCRKDMAIICLGKPLCEEHWIKYCGGGV